jgi:hypothetical protein
VTYFALVYGPTITEEAERLTALFGHRYVEYAARVPALVPRLSPYRAPRAARLAHREPALQGPEEPAAGQQLRPDELTSDFSWSQYVRNREWEALLGALAAFAILAIKLRWMG